jgi:hypothetical protein
MNKPLEMLVEFDLNGNAKPLVMQWQGRGVRFNEIAWCRKEWKDDILHHFFGVKDESHLYTLDFNTGTCDWTVAKVQPTAA